MGVKVRPIVLSLHSLSKSSSETINTEQLALGHQHSPPEFSETVADSESRTPFSQLNRAPAVKTKTANSAEMVKTKSG